MTESKTPKQGQTPDKEPEPEPRVEAEVLKDLDVPATDSQIIRGGCSHTTVS
jgi:hypothetical protein